MTIQDYDLSACLEYNPQDGFVLEDVKEIRAVWEGENEGDNWRWILELNDGRQVFLEGGCDYTGWDCQSSASSTIGADLKEACVDFINQPVKVQQSLGIQLLAGKNETWREKMLKEFGF